MAFESGSPIIGVKSPTWVGDTEFQSQVDPEGWLLCPGSVRGG